MGEGDEDSQPITFSRLAEIGTGWLGLSEADFWECTLHSFNTRLKGWREAKEADRLEAWRQNRNLAGYVLAIGQWQKGKAPDIMQLMPLPGDPKADTGLIEISDEEMARRKYKAKKAHGIKFNDEFETLIRTHYQPSWGPHPDELVKPKN